MPLLEIIQSRQISASVRFDETTATRANQRAALLGSARTRTLELRIPARKAGIRRKEPMQSYVKSSKISSTTPALLSSAFCWAPDPVLGSARLGARYVGVQIGRQAHEQ